MFPSTGQTPSTIPVPKRRIAGKPFRTPHGASWIAHRIRLCRYRDFFLPAGLVKKIPNTARVNHFWPEPFGPNGKNRRAALPLCIFFCYQGGDFAKPETTLPLQEEAFLSVNLFSGIFFMNILDIIFTVIACFLLLRGIYRGLFVEIASLVGAVLGLYLANTYSGALSKHAAKLITNPDWAEVVSYLVIFFACIIVLSLIASTIKKLLGFALGGWLDHLAGSVVGLFKGVLVCCVILLVLNRYMPEAQYVKESNFAPHLQPYTELLDKYLPAKLKGKDTPAKESEDEETPRDEGLNNSRGPVRYIPIV